MGVVLFYFGVFSCFFLVFIDLFVLDLLFGNFFQGLFTSRKIVPQKEKGKTLSKTI